MLERTVQIRAHDALNARTFSATVVQRGERLNVPLDRRVADVNLVSAKPHAASRGRTPDDCRLFLCERRRDRQQRETVRTLAARLDVMRIRDRAAQHLKAAADADDRCAAPMLRENPRVEVLRTQPAE